jgi:hypothetical protein
VVRIPCSSTIPFDSECHGRAGSLRQLGGESAVAAATVKEASGRRTRKLIEDDLPVQ